MNIIIKGEPVSLSFEKYVTNEATAIVAYCENGEIYDVLTTNGFVNFRKDIVCFRSDNHDYINVLVLNKIIKPELIFSEMSGYIFLEYYQLTDEILDNLKEE